jgi:NAD-dependent dihydropyrimidine dehydrogenase PreA subunit
MAYVIAEPCIDVKDGRCVEECPVNCIYEGPDQFYIHPDECIDCGACDRVCPVVAIYPDNLVPKKWESYVEKNALFFGVKRIRRPGASSGG